MTHANLLAELVDGACERAGVFMQGVDPDLYARKIERLYRIQVLAAAAVHTFGRTAPITVSIEDFELFETWYDCGS